MQKEFEKICSEAKVIGAVGVVTKDNKTIQELSYGKSSIENNQLMTVDTVFRIASISKIIVAMAMMKLVEEGKANIYHDVSEYLGFELRNPLFPNDIITLEMIMTQTSSITDGNDNGTTGYNNVNGTNLKVGLKDLLLVDGAYYSKDTFDINKPGTKFIYSNFGCGILACIVEKVSGELFTDYVRKNILLPLDIDASFIPQDIKNPLITSTYVLKNNEIKLVRSKEKFLGFAYDKFPLGENYRGPAGGLFINMRDLSKIASVFINNGTPILKKETIDMMMQIHWYGNDDGYKAKGLQIKINDDINGRIVKGHTGSAYGVRSFMFFNYEQKLVMLFIINGGAYIEDDERFTSVSNNILKLYLDNYWQRYYRHYFEFKDGSNKGIVDGRTIDLVYTKKDNDIYFDVKTAMDAFNTKLDESIVKDKSLRQLIEENDMTVTIKDNIYLIEYFGVK